MPIFDSAKGDIPWHLQPNIGADAFGGSNSSMQAEGTLFHSVTGAGANVGGLTGDYVLAAYTLPAGAFDGMIIPTATAGVTSNALSNRGIQIESTGGFGPTNATNKRLKIWIGCTTAVVGSVVSGGTLIADSGNVTTVSVGWSIGSQVYKLGAAGSNTQVAIHQPTIAGATVGSLLAPVYLTLTEASPIIIAVTGFATTAVADVYHSLTVISGMN
jgi:hypothetical protein